MKRQPDVTVQVYIVRHGLEAHINRTQFLVDFAANHNIKAVAKDLATRIKNLIQIRSAQL